MVGIAWVWMDGWMDGWRLLCEVVGWVIFMWFLGWLVGRIVSGGERVSKSALYLVGVDGCCDWVGDVDCGDRSAP